MGWGGLNGYQVIRTSDVGRRMGRHQNWMDYVNYYDDEGRIEASFSPSIKPYISLLARRFTTMGITHVAKFGSFYAIRLYELLLQFRETGWRRLELTELREILQIGPKQYPKFSEFRHRIIEPSVLEINAKSDYRVTWAKEIEGRNVVAVRFEFERQAQLSLAI